MNETDSNSNRESAQQEPTTDTVPDLSRDPDDYVLTRHAKNRVHDRERELNVAIIKNAIRDGELQPADGDCSKFIINVGPTEFTVIVSNDTGPWGLHHNIVTAYPEYEK